MKSMMKKTTMREIKGSFGRFFAIMAIIALGVGFFSGLKITKDVMVGTANKFLKENNFFDLHLLSTLGFDDEDVAAFSHENQVRYAEGIYSADALYSGIGEGEEVLKAFSVPEQINQAELISGRMPENVSECVIDARIDGVELGDKISLSQTNDDEKNALFREKEFTIVGKSNTPYYINFERGSTSLGNGKLKGYIYIMPEAFCCDSYTDVFICFDHSYDIYTDEYTDFMEDKQEAWEQICKTRVDTRYEELCSALGYALPKADSYVLDRNTNIGYACFESDSGIVDAIAKVFPIFFILVAVLVCMTTMNRMVEEQRTQIGVLKALGYRESAIMGKYTFYSGSAALIGCIIGYTVGIYVFPTVIWTAYQMMYVKMKPVYLFDWKLGLVVLFVSLLCSVGTTWLTCRYELSETAASLMRPKAPKAGKRVLLERISFVWKRMKFLHKVSVRNIFRYKKRFFMMVLGIGGCTALLLTGFGIKDSISGFAEKQYDEIQIFDASIVLKEGVNSETENDITQLLDENVKDYMCVSESAWDLLTDKKVKSINLVIAKQPENFADYMNFHTTENETIAYPKKGEAVINQSIADLYHIEVGDSVVIRDADMREISVTISGIFVNYIYNYIFISPETYEEQLGEAPGYQSVYVHFKDETDVHQASAGLMNEKQVASVTINQDIKERMAKMTECLNYIVLLIIICAAALAFVVLYNLTNINITERIREIATIKVLGFFRNETSSYVFRENRVLTSIGILLGLVLGIFLHRFVIQQIHVDMVSFDVYIAPLSYLYSVILTFVFNFAVNLVMSAKLEHINMAESLKSVE